MHSHEHEPDRINDALVDALRVGLTVAGHRAERAARAREQEVRRAKATSEQETRQLQARLDAERAAARAALAPVYREEWWAHADVEDITRAWEIAQSWRDVGYVRGAGDVGPYVRGAGERIEGQLRRRYGIDTRELAADAEAVRDGLAVRVSSGHDPGRESAHVRGEASEASGLLAGADRPDARYDRALGEEDRDDASVHLDRARYRDDVASSLEGAADAETIAARTVAATNQARPAREAVARTPARAGRAGRAGGTGRIEDRSRSR